MGQHRPRRIVGAVLTLSAIITALVATTSAASAAVEVSPSSTSWTSTTEGWVLGWSPCDTAVCATLVHTTDAGATWARETAPPVTPSEYGNQARVFFAERGKRTVGLATNGEALYATYDGAQSWQETSLADYDRVGDIAATARQVYVAAQRETATGVDTQVFSAHIGRPDWSPVDGFAASHPGSLASTLTDLSATPKALSFAVSSFGEFVQVWTTTKPHRHVVAAPCDAFASTRVAAVARDREFVLCSSNPGRGAMDKEAKSSPDGSAFDSVGLAPRLGITTDFAAADGSTLAVGATGGDMGIVHMSYDGGSTWETTFGVPDTGPVLDLHFQDATHGTLVTGYPGLGTSAVFRTVDAGHTWTEVELTLQG